MVQYLREHFSHMAILIPVTYMALFHVVNPIGSGILFLNLTPEADNKLRRKIALKIALNSFALMTVILIAGVYLLKLFGITIPIVQMCGGLMILTMGWHALNKVDDTNESDNKMYLKDSINVGSRYHNQAFYPFTFPFTVGPGTIAVTLTISAETIQNTPGNDLFLYAGALIAILLIAVSIYISFSSANYLMGKVSEPMRKVIMKILSFVLLCIGGQIIMNGFTSFLRNLNTAGII